ncbi:glutathione S-transferase N-terminal domain-containing protein [Nitrincola tapanii]|uniref:Glutaredoxin n=1 Tax=Nitrincola tapanii TaxID=1708751 RepID=A0A5A9W519_9GAMM|nr:glutathione S-transferase N-terminal domain-containing protein [Nitrincola tapanii]KAA0875880.1 glutaredoxin [Nitrincola tapanii]
MKSVIRLFFRLLRVLLTPVMLLQEVLTRPKAVTRSPEVQSDVDLACQSLALYQFKACPFCIKVRKQIHRLALPIELRDAQAEGPDRQALLAGGGRVKVPCLRIEHADGSSEWLYESDAINQWLEKRFG